MILKFFTSLLSFFLKFHLSLIKTLFFLLFFKKNVNLYYRVGHYDLYLYFKNYYHQLLNFHFCKFILMIFLILLDQGCYQIKTVLYGVGDGHLNQRIGLILLLNFVS